MAELGFVNDEIAAKKAADSIDLADYSDEKAVEREYRKLAMEALEGIRCHLHSSIEAVFQPRCEWTAKGWPYEQYQKL